MAIKDPLDIITMATQLGMINKEITAGYAFGERALTSRDEKRSATILTNQDCEFIILMKEDYLRILGKYNIENRFKLNFLKDNIPYINQVLSSSILEDYLYIFHAEFFKRGNTVVEQDTHGSRVYFLVEGQCCIEKTLNYDGSSSLRENHKKVFISQIGPPSVIGEEIIFAIKVLLQDLLAKLIKSLKSDFTVFGGDAKGLPLSTCLTNSSLSL